MKNIGIMFFSEHLALEDIYTEKYVGYGYVKYARHLWKSFLMGHESKNKLEPCERTKELLLQCKEYYLFARNIGNTTCVTDLTQVYVELGEYENLCNLFNETNYYEKNNDFCQKYLIICSTKINNTNLVELHFGKMQRKTGFIYIILGNYYKKLKQDEIAIKYYKFASDNGRSLGSYIVGTWYVRQKDIVNATKYFLKIFSFKKEFERKITACQHLLDLKQYPLVRSLLQKERLNLINLTQIKQYKLEKFQTRYENKMRHFLNCFDYLYVIFLNATCKFAIAKTSIDELYNRIIMTNIKLKTTTTNEIVMKLNDIFMQYKNSKKLQFDISAHCDISIWFMYHRINKNYCELFCQYPLIARRVDKLINKTEKHYMSLEDVNVLTV